MTFGDVGATRLCLRSFSIGTYLKVWQKEVEMTRIITGVNSLYRIGGVWEKHHQRATTWPERLTIISRNPLRAESRLRNVIDLLKSELPSTSYATSKGIRIYFQHGYDGSAPLFFRSMVLLPGHSRAAGREGVLRYDVPSSGRTETVRLQ